MMWILLVRVVLGSSKERATAVLNCVLDISEDVVDWVLFQTHLKQSVFLYIQLFSLT